MLYNSVEPPEQDSSAKQSEYFPRESRIISPQTKA